MRTRISFWAMIALLLLGCGMAHAQVLYGTLTGNVIDPSGAPVPAAKVEAANTDTGVVRETTTDERGSYLFANIGSGTYKITVTAHSFKTMIEENVLLNTSEIRRVDFTLQISQTSETVEVNASAAVLQTDKADIHTEVTSQEVTELPYQGTEGKNFQSLLLLLPGANTTAGTGEANSQAGNPQRAVTVSMNGASSQANATRLDGTMNSYPWLPVNIAYAPSAEAIETVSVSANAFDAEQGAAGSAAINVTIKTGTNSLHGSLFERNTNNDLVAVNNYFYHPGRLSKNIFNQYGFAVGGPVWIPHVIHGKNKLFWFMDYEGTKNNQFASDVNLTLPTAAMRTGDFSATGTTIYDPLTGNSDGTGRSPFPGNIIPSNRLAPAAVTLAGLLPALTRTPVAGNNTNYYSNYDSYGATSYSVDRWDFKTTYNPTQKATIWGRYSLSPMDIYTPFVLGPARGDAYNGGNPGTAGGRVQVSAAGLTYSFTPTLLLDGNVGYTRQHIGANGDPQDGDFGLDQLKIPGTNGVGPNYEGIPGFQVSGFANIGNTNTGSPFEFRDNQYTSTINLTKIKGAHNIKFGWEYDKYALNHFQPQGGTFGTARGTFGFDGSITSLKGGTAINTGSPSNSWAQFMLGYPSEVGKVTQFTDPIALRFATWSAYARDIWQVAPKLTIDYGLRWEYYPIYSHDHFGATRFDPTTDDIYIGGENGVPWDAGATATKKNFAPRLGVAYRLDEKTVIRSGYGISVDPDNMRNQRNQYPAIVNQQYNPPNTYQFISYAGVANSDGSPQVSLSDGIPTPSFPTISAGIITPSPTASLTTYLPSTSTDTFPKYFNRGYYQNWNFFVQHEFSSTLWAEAGYVGMHGVRTQINVNINGAAPGTGTAGEQLYPYDTASVLMYEPFGDYLYDALQMRVRKRIGASLIGANYTFAKGLDNMNGDNGDSGLFRAYPVSTSLDKALNGIVRAQTLSIYYVYQLPIGVGHKYVNHGFATYIIGGWQLSSIISRYAGLPINTIGTTSSINASGQTDTANQILSDVQILGGHDSAHPYYNGLAFANPPAGVLGSTGRDLLIGPGLFQMNASISKTFAFKEGKLKFQLTGEAYNLTNTPVFSNPGGSCCWSSTATATSGSGYNGFGVITGTSNPSGLSQGQRYIQVGGYLRF